MGRSRYKIFENEYPYFLTCTTVGWLPVFTRPVMRQFVYDSWKYLADHRGFQVFAFVILENHLHLIAKSKDLATDIGDFKSFTARQIIDWLEERHVRTILSQFKSLKAAHKTDRTYQVWQEGSHPQQIQSDEMMLQKIEYIHTNPMERDYVDRPEDWKHSSARAYLRQPCLYPVITDW